MDYVELCRFIKSYRRRVWKEIFFLEEQIFSLGQIDIGVKGVCVCVCLFFSSYSFTRYVIPFIFFPPTVHASDEVHVGVGKCAKFLRHVEIPTFFRYVLPVQFFVDFCVRKMS